MAEREDAAIEPFINGMFAKWEIGGLLPEAMRLLVKVGTQAHENDYRISVELYNEIGAFCTEAAQVFRTYQDSREAVEKATEGTDTYVSF